MRCEFCQKEIELYFPESNNLLDASYITLYDNIPVIDSGFGSCHDGDLSFFSDRKLATEIKQKLQTEKYLYICDECFEKIKDKLIVIEGMSFPWVLHKCEPEHVYQPIPRNIVALTYEQLFNMSDEVANTKYNIQITKTHPIGIKHCLGKLKTKVNFDEILIINEGYSFEVMDKTLFQKLFIPKV